MDWHQVQTIFERNTAATIGWKKNQRLWILQKQTAIVTNESGVDEEFFYQMDDDDREGYIMNCKPYDQIFSQSLSSIRQVVIFFS